MMLFVRPNPRHSQVWRAIMAASTLNRSQLFGFALASKGHDTRALQAYLGHKNIQHTVRYTELSPTRFKTFWRV